MLSLVRRHSDGAIRFLRRYCVHTASTANEEREHYDIIIAGGGLVGTTLAATLSKSPMLYDKRILLLEGGKPFKGFNSQSQYSNRVSAINSNTVKLFKSIGVWDHMVAARVKPVKQMQVWDASSDALIHFYHNHFADDVACIVENDLILDAVYSSLSSRTDANASNVTVRNEARINSVQLPFTTGTEHSLITLDDKMCFSCDLIIGADGFNSMVRKEMGVNVYSTNYERMGVVATVEVSEAEDNTVAWQRFISNGPVAMLPLNENLSSIVWSTTTPHAKELVAMDDIDFVNALNKAFCAECPKEEVVVKALSTLNSIMGRGSQNFRQFPPRISGVLNKSRASFPLGFLHASSYVCNGAAIIGDAAHRIHPLAGQGVNLGFSDVTFMVEALSEAAYAGAKLGDQQYLLKYERNSLTKNLPIIVGVHGLQRLYSTDLAPVVLLRSLGLQFTENFPTLKQFFMKRAMG